MLVIDYNGNDKDKDNDSETWTFPNKSDIVIFSNNLPLHAYKKSGKKTTCKNYRKKWATNRLTGRKMDMLLQKDTTSFWAEVQKVKMKSNLQIFSENPNYNQRIL